MDEVVKPRVCVSYYTFRDRESKLWRWRINCWNKRTRFAFEWVVVFDGIRMKGFKTSNGALIAAKQAGRLLGLSEVQRE